MPAMDYGLVLPSLGDAANRDGIAAAVELAEEHGFTDVWATDHILVPHDAADDYGRLYEAISTLAWIAGRSRAIRLGTSVIVVPMRNAVVLAKELATLDALSEGRVIAGFGVGWNREEFANVGTAELFEQRGAYTEETINLCRHLWSGLDGPVPGPLPLLRGFRLRAAAGAGRRNPDLDRCPRRAGAAARRSPGRWLPLVGRQSGDVREARAGDPGGRRGSGPVDAPAVRAHPRGAGRRRGVVLHDARLTRRRGRPRFARSRPSASTTWPWPSHRATRQDSGARSSASSTRCDRWSERPLA